MNIIRIHLENLNVHATDGDSLAHRTESALYLDHSHNVDIQRDVLVSVAPYPILVLVQEATDSGKERNDHSGPILVLLFDPYRKGGNTCQVLGP
jgi:hypothetical protein